MECHKKRIWNDAKARLVCACDVRECARVRVMAVERDALERHGAELRVGDGAHDALDLLGKADADRVAERDLVAAELVVGARHLSHALRRHYALVRTARDTRHVAAHKCAGARELLSLSCFT